MPRTLRKHGAGWLSRLLGFAQAALLIVSVAAALWLVVTFPVWWHDAPRMDLPLGAALDEGAAPASISGDAIRLERIGPPSWRAELEVRFADPWHQWLYIFFALQEIVLLTLILHFVRKVVGSIAGGRVFTRRNVRYLRWAGGLLILEALYVPGASSLLSRWVVDGLTFDGGRLLVDWTSEIGPTNIFTGWVVLTVSEAFRQGAELREEQSLTV